MVLKGKDRVGTTIKNFKILDYKRENKKNFYLIYCGLCDGEKWMRSDVVINPKTKSCGCQGATKNDLSNKTFGRLRVISMTEERARNNSVIWECECSCGKRKLVSRDHLIRDHVKSCGCLHQKNLVKSYSLISESAREWINPEEQIGMIIKNFELLDHKYERRKHHYFIRCLICERKKWMYYSTIINPITQGCGCQRKAVNKIDLTGQIFGRLTAISSTEKRDSRSVVWECVCSCGGKKQVSAKSLLRGYTKSCGCLSSEIHVKEYSNESEDNKKIDPRDQIGMTINNFKILDHKHENKSHQYFINCLLCGNEKWMYYSVIKGAKSCGCLILETADKVEINDGMTNFLVARFVVEGTNLSVLAQKEFKTNTSGFKGVCWDKQRQKWCAIIGFQGKKIVLGYFVNIKDAAAARKKGEEKYHKPMLEKYKDRLSPKQLTNLDGDKG